LAAKRNDSDTVKTESDFKKHYEFKSRQPQQEVIPVSPETGGQWRQYTAMTVGIGLLIGTVGLITFNGRQVFAGK